jgi:hypothetical protein
MAKGIIQAANYFFGGLAVISDLLGIGESMFSTMESEVHDIYKYTFQINENLNTLMKHLELPLTEKNPPEIETPAEERLDKYSEFQDKHKLFKYGKYAAWPLYTPFFMTFDTLSAIKKIDEFNKQNYELQKKIETENEIELSLDNTLEEHYDPRKPIEDLHEKHPFTFPLPPSSKKEEEDESLLAKNNIDDLSSSVRQLHEKIDLVKADIDGYRALDASLIQPGGNTEILSRLEQMDIKLASMQPGITPMGVETPVTPEAVKPVVAETVAMMNSEETFAPMKEMFTEQVKTAVFDALPDQAQDNEELIQRIEGAISTGVGVAVNSAVEGTLVHAVTTAVTQAAQKKSEPKEPIDVDALMRRFGERLNETDSAIMKIVIEVGNQILKRIEMFEDFIKFNALTIDDVYKKFTDKVYHEAKQSGLLD